MIKYSIHDSLSVFIILRNIKLAENILLLTPNKKDFNKENKNKNQLLFKDLIKLNKNKRVFQKNDF